MRSEHIAANSQMGKQYCIGHSRHSFVNSSQSAHFPIRLFASLRQGPEGGYQNTSKPAVPRNGRRCSMLSEYCKKFIFQLLITSIGLLLCLHRCLRRVLLQSSHCEFLALESHDISRRYRYKMLAGSAQGDTKCALE